MAKPQYIELDDGKWSERIPILYEDRSVIAIDKPAGWMLVPFSWQRTDRNLMAAIASSIAVGAFWAKCRNLKFLRNVHRLDADTSGILLLATSVRAVHTFGELFESHAMSKTYLAVVHGVPRQTHWICRQKISPDPQQFGRMMVDARAGKEAETEFQVLDKRENTTLVEARPYSGRTHQIRVHLKESGHPVVGDVIYGPEARAKPTKPETRASEFTLALRAIELAYHNPFTRLAVRIVAPREAFLRNFRFSPAATLASVVKPANPSTAARKQ